MKFSKAFTATTTAQEAVNPHPKRTSLTIFNNSTTQPVYYGADSELTATEGMVILPQTGWAFLLGLGDNPSTAFYLITAALTADVRIS